MAIITPYPYHIISQPESAPAEMKGKAFEYPTIRGGCGTIGQIMVYNISPKVSHFL